MDGSGPVAIVQNINDLAGQVDVDRKLVKQW